jgi:hypothetical protein
MLVAINALDGGPELETGPREENKRRPDDKIWGLAEQLYCRLCGEQRHQWLVWGMNGKDLLQSRCVMARRMSRGGGR